MLIYRYYLCLFVVGSCLSFCTTSSFPIEEAILGTWQINNKHYKARFKITQTNQQIMGQVLYYDDGTTKYTWQADQARFIFKDLSYTDGLWVDAISGATSNKNPSPQRTFRLHHHDTLEVSTVTDGYRSIEKWIRQQ